MTGYQIFEYKNSSLIKDNGIKVFEFKSGILDLLRDLNEESVTIPKLYKAAIIGLDEVLYFFETDKNEEIAYQIKKILSKAAKELYGKVASLQIICKGKLIPGSILKLEYRSKTLPIDLIFGSPIVERDINGNEFYRANFSLTS